MSDHQKEKEKGIMGNSVIIILFISSIVTGSVRFPLLKTIYIYIRVYRFLKRNVVGSVIWYKNKTINYKFNL